MFPILLFAAAGLVTLVGLVLVLRSIRGRRLDDHRVCAKCRYDLFGTPGDAASCPECGAKIGRRRAVRIGNRATHGRRLAAGALALLVGLSGGSYLGLSAKRGYNWNRHAPMPLLLHDAFHSNSPRRARSAAYVFYDRHHAGTLSAGDYDRVINGLLDYQADHTKPWDTFWGDLLEILRHHGHVTDDQWRRFLTQVYRWELVGPPTIKPGGRWTYEFKFIGPPRSARSGSTYISAFGFSPVGSQTVEFVIEGVTNDGDTIRVEDPIVVAYEDYRVMADSEGLSEFFMPKILLPAEQFPPGRYTCSTTFVWHLYDTRLGIPYVSIRGHRGGHVQSSNPITYTATFEIVEP